MFDVNPKPKTTMLSTLKELLPLVLKKIADLAAELVEAKAAPIAFQGEIDAAQARAETAEKALTELQAKFDSLTAEDVAEEEALASIAAALKAAIA
jgi:predicted  nucleic acid-binding Zn-ribbon protein